MFLTTIDWVLQLEYLLRLVLAAVLGGLIGIEREMRMKEAGVRTHLIVCLTASLMMVVSKYGFFDLLGTGGISLDPSRVAAGIVTGVGFLGAGIIFSRGHTISGLTTSAGIWATVGVGMALGAGMYIVGVAAALFILLIQAVLHRDLTILRGQALRSVRIVVEDTPAALPTLFQTLTSLGVDVSDAHLRRRSIGLEVRLVSRMPPGVTPSALFSPLLDSPLVRDVKW